MSEAASRKFGRANKFDHLMVDKSAVLVSNPTFGGIVFKGLRHVDESSPSILCIGSTGEVFYVGLREIVELVSEELKSPIIDLTQKTTTGVAKVVPAMEETEDTEEETPAESFKQWQEEMARTRALRKKKTKN